LERTLLLCILMMVTLNIVFEMNDIKPLSHHFAALHAQHWVQCDYYTGYVHKLGHLTAHWTNGRMISWTASETI
jgi:hypothetical protein